MTPMQPIPALVPAHAGVAVRHRVAVGVVAVEAVHVVDAGVANNSRYLPSTHVNSSLDVIPDSA